MQMRARGFALRDAFPDVLSGLIAVEEAEDYPVRDTRGQLTTRPAGPVIEAHSTQQEPLPEASPQQPVPTRPITVSNYRGFPGDAVREVVRKNALESATTGIAAARTRQELDAVGQQIKKLGLSMADREDIKDLFMDRLKELPADDEVAGATDTEDATNE